MADKPSTTLQAVAPLLINLGFRKRAGEVFTTEAAKDVLGWLGLNRATQHRPAGEVEINPVVGVRHQGVERLVAEFRGDKFHAYLPPTISSPLGHLLPEARYRAWIFSPSNADVVAADMVGAVATYGLPFIHAMSDLNALCQALDNRMGFEHQLAYRRPVAWLLAGDSVRARKMVDESVASLHSRSDLAAADFRRFAEALSRRF